LNGSCIGSFSLEDIQKFYNEKTEQVDPK
jgi:hypothetical protein